MWQKVCIKALNEIVLLSAFFNPLWRSYTPAKLRRIQVWKTSISICDNSVMIDATRTFTYVCYFPLAIKLDIAFAYKITIDEIFYQFRILYKNM